MKPVSFVLVFVLALSCTLSLFPVRAEARTIVVPDNYPSIASAVASARDGDTVYVRSGIYEEHSLRINKTLTLKGEDPEKTIIKGIDPMDRSPLTPPWASPTYPMAIQISADNVCVSGFTIRYDFISIESIGDGATITGNILNQTQGLYVTGNNNTITHNLSWKDPNLKGRGGWHIYCGGSNNVVAFNKISGPCFDAIVIYGGSNVVYGNTLTNRSGGISLGGRSSIDLFPATPPGVDYDGNIIAKNNLTDSLHIEIYRGSDLKVIANRIVNSATENRTGGGLVVYGGSGKMFVANHVENMGSGIFGSPANNTFYHNNFVNNWRQISQVDLLSDYMDDGSEGNFWSDYNGTDADGDGVGDTPYTIGLVTDRYPLMAPFDIDSVEVELPEWVDLSALEPPEFNPLETEPSQTAEPFPTVPVIAASSASLVVVGAALTVYFKKRKRSASPRISILNIS